MAATTSAVCTKVAIIPWSAALCSQDHDRQDDELDHHRGMASQKANELRRLLADVEVNEKALRTRPQDRLHAHTALQSADQTKRVNSTPAKTAAATLTCNAIV
jgi:hypothetical protein